MVDKWDVDTISMAIGMPYHNNEIASAIDYAVYQRKTIFAAASNEGSEHGKPAFPARMLQVFCVFSASGKGTPSRFNPLPQESSDNFALLGEGVPSGYPMNLLTSKYIRRSGTSSATSVAAGIAALVLGVSSQEYANLSEELSRRLRSYSGMRDIFIAMSNRPRVEACQGYDIVRPWDLITDKEKDRAFVIREISRLMESL